MYICRCSVLRPSLLLTCFFEGNYVLLLLGGDSRMTAHLANVQRLFVAAQDTVRFDTSVKCCVLCSCGLLGSFLFVRLILWHILCRKDFLFLHQIDEVLSFELNFRLWPPSFVRCVTQRSDTVYLFATLKSLDYFAYCVCHSVILVHAVRFAFKGLRVVLFQGNNLKWF